MPWNDIWKIVLGIIASFGGIGGIILAVIKFSSNILADKLSQKYELKMNKELEKYKAGIENKTHMSKTKFDAEFSMYRELSQTFAILVKECAQLFPTFTKDVRDDYEKYKPIHDRCVDAIVSAQDKLNACVPFISENIFQGYDELEKLCKTQLSDFQDFRLRPDAKEYRENCSDAFRETYRRTKEIQQKYREVSADLRTYINSIDVIN